MYLTKEAEEWKRLVHYTALDAFNRSKWRPGKGQIVVDYWLSLGDEMDVDNTNKLTFDSLAKAIGVNDKVFLPRCQEKLLRQVDEGVVLHLRNLLGVEP
jgi:hypothetical protein